MRLKNLKIIVLLFCVLFVIIFHITPVIALEQNERVMGNLPLERVVMQNGLWHADAWTYENKTNLIVGYRGNYEIDESFESLNDNSFDIEIKELTKITGVFIPFAKKAEGNVVISLLDKNGEKLGRYTMMLENNADEHYMDSSDNDNGYNYVLSIKSGIKLDNGIYTVEISNSNYQVRNERTGKKGAFLIKGIGEEGIESNRFNLDKDDSQKDIDSEGFQKHYDENLEMMMFTLDKEYIFEEININTYNEGLGAKPGEIHLLNEEYEIIEKYNAIGKVFRDVENAKWVAKPDVLLMAGTYFIKLSEPSVVEYDESGSPEFSISFAHLDNSVVDFSGTYNFNLNVYRTSTLLGAESGENVFSLEDFELVVFDKDSEIELIGRYEGVPFSQRCSIIEFDHDYILAEFDFALDNAILPEYVRVNVEGEVAIFIDEQEDFSINVDGRAIYHRDSSSERGQDYNTYNVIGRGKLVSDSFPPFVMTALGRVGSAGSFPGPENTNQLVVGLLFPPLVGLVSNLVVENMKKRKKQDQSDVEKYTYDYFKNKYPHMSDHDIAMQILAVSRPDPDSMFARDDDASKEAVREADIESYEEFERKDSMGKDGDSPIVDSDKEKRDYSTKDDRVDYEKENVNKDVSEKENDGFKEGEIYNQEKTDNTEYVELPTMGRGANEWWIKDNETGLYTNYFNKDQVYTQTDIENRLRTIEHTEGFLQEQRERSREGDTAFDRYLQEGEERRQEELRTLEQLDRLERRYGTRDRYEIRNMQRQEQFKNEERFENQMRYGDRLQRVENTLGVVDRAADTAIDGLASCTGPLGRSIQAGYITTREIGRTMASEGVSVSSFASGAVRGGTTAATNYTGSGLRSRIANVGLEVAGDTIGEVIDNGTDEARRQFVESTVSNTINQTVGAATDQMADVAADQMGYFRGGYGNDITTTNVYGNRTVVDVNSNGNWSSRMLSRENASNYVSKKYRSQATRSTVKFVNGMIDDKVVN